jgi:sterol 3beta-glucosyltransferase
VLPRPADWPEHLHVTGDWPLDPPDDWRPPRALLEFLRAGPPPVYVGVPGAAASLALGAVARCGLRAVLQDDGRLPAGLPLSPTVIRVDNVPQRWLFPRMAALVHAGDAASTAAGLRAGVPALVVAHGAPLAAWSHLLSARGFGLVAGPGASAARLAALLTQVLADAPLRDRLVRLSDVLEREHGIERAVAVIGEAVR